jgi:hypothetical protein
MARRFSACLGTIQRDGLMSVRSGYLQPGSDFRAVSRQAETAACRLNSRGDILTEGAPGQLKSTL